ncbi:MAG: pilus assembly protein [Sphingomonadales bacterium]|nr:pilus assembly protein [Sphingomonadales bacterium]
MIRPVLNHLRRDKAGVTVIEFALLAPVLMVMLFGLLDLAYNMYTAQMLQGAVQDAARKSTIEGAANSAAAVDGIVTTAVRTVAPGATLNFSRKAYTNFTNAARPEDFDDVNTNGTCDDGEPFEDANGNGNWDLDPGVDGFGSARDAVLYTVQITYPRAFPIFAFIPGQSDTYDMQVTSVLRNQPYGQQNVGAAPATGNCT